MKAMKKVFAMLLALAMAMGLHVTAFADTDYSITVTNTPSQTNVSIVGKTFSAYKLFDVSYADTDTGAEGNEAFAYSISGTSSWFDAVLLYMGGGENAATADQTTGVYTGGGLKLTPTAANSAVYVVETTADETTGQSAFGDSEARAFADSLTKWLNKQTTSKPAAAGTAQGAKDSTGSDESATISVADAGYYLVTGTSASTANSQEVVAAAVLKTTQPTAAIDLKAQAPTLDKEIVNGNSDNNYGTSAEVGETVNFKLTSSVPDATGYDSYTYTVTDTLSKGLTLNVDSSNEANTFTVKVGAADITLTRAADADSVAGDSYYITNNTDGSTTFKISLAMLDTDGNAKYTKGTAITIEYSAAVNENALTTDVETNTAALTYSSDPYDNTKTGTTPEEKVYVYDFDIIVDKYTGDDSDADNPAARLADAEFVLYKTVTVDGTEKTLYYKYTAADTASGTAAGVSWVESIDNATVVTTGTDGKASFRGVEAGTYYLRETKAPAGYNLLTADQEVEITAAYGDDGTITETNTASTSGGQYSITSKVENKTGTALPSTGGIGTTIFYVAGTILVLGAAILLIVKKRMSGTEE